MQRVRFGVDPHNRLVVRKTGKRGRLTRFRKVVNGKFKVSKNNILTYYVKAPVPQGLHIPHQVKLRGEWSLNNNHDLQLTLDKWGRQTFGDKLVLQGDIIDVHKNSLLFAVTTLTKEHTPSVYVLKLQGSWQSDEHNRLTLRIKKERGGADILTFDGIWELNKNHRIIYQYEKARLIRKLKKIHTLTFRGYWDIKEKARIAYVLDRNTASVFNFKSSLGLFEGNYIKYEAGIGLSHKLRPIRRTITLFGTWKVKRNAGLLFEVEYENKKVHAITFGADAKLTAKDTVLFKLKKEMGKRDLGAHLKLSHKILKGDGEAFLRLLRSNQESAVYIGVGRRW